MTTDPQAEHRAIRRGEREDVFPITASRLKLYDICPRWFSFEYGGAGGLLVERLPRVQGPAAELGDRFHRLMQDVHNGAMLHEAAERYSVPLEMWPRWIDLRRKARDFIHTEDPGELAGLEETISWRFPLRDGREAEAEARLDELYLRPDDSALVRDYKTGSPFGIPAGKELRKDVQVQTYALAVHKRHPLIWRYHLELLLPESGERRRVRLELDDVEQWEGALTAKTQVMAEDVDYEPRPGRQCKFCPYAVAHCPLGQKLNGPFPPLTTTQEAKARAALLFYVEGVHKQLKEDVEEWVVAEGPVPAGDGSYAKHTSHSQTIPPERMGDAVKVLRQYGVDEDADDYPLAWFAKSGNRYIQDDSDAYIPELGEMTVRRTRSYFGHRKNRRPSRRHSPGGYDS